MVGLAAMHRGQRVLADPQRILRRQVGGGRREAVLQRVLEVLPEVGGELGRLLLAAEERDDGQLGRVQAAARRVGWAGRQGPGGERELGRHGRHRTWRVCRRSGMRGLRQLCCTPLP